MNFKEQKLKEFKNFASGREIEYDYPLDQHIIYDDIELFISNLIDEQEKIHKISNECMKVCYEESEKRLRDECAKSITMMGAEFKKKIEKKHLRLSKEEVKKKVLHELECFHIPFDKNNGFVTCLVRDILALQDKEINNG